MAIEVIGTIKPKNGGKFPIVEDVDVSVKLTTHTAFDYTTTEGNRTRYSQLVYASEKPADGGNFRINKVGIKAAANVTVRFLLCEVTRNEDNTAVLKQVAVLGDAAADSESGIAVLEFAGGYQTELDYAAIVACTESSVIQVYDLPGLTLEDVLSFDDANYYDSQNGTEITACFTDSESGAEEGIPIALIDCDLIKVMTLSEYVNRGGSSGKSAYEVAVDNGFEGTEEEWLESLQGADGAPGADGKTPVKGTDYFTPDEVAAIAQQAADLVEVPEDSVATNVDLSAYESGGIIKETFADGTTKTTTIEFDANGNPVKITDGDGNVTTLTW